MEGTVGQGGRYGEGGNMSGKESSMLADFTKVGMKIFSPLCNTMGFINDNGVYVAEIGTG